MIIHGSLLLCQWIIKGKKVRLISAKDEDLSKIIFRIKGEVQVFVCNEEKVLKNTDNYVLT